MSVTKFISVSVAGLGLVGLGSASGQSAAKAREILLTCMQSAGKVNVTAILSQRDSGLDGGFQKVKLQRSKTGQSRHTVLQPLRMQGIEAVDDGDTLMVYLPNDGVVIRRDSPAKFGTELIQRMDLATKNYTFRCDPKTKVADRSAYCVVATPNNKALDVRRFYIDEEHFFPLRLETSKKDAMKLMYDTVYIEFPKSIQASTFKLSIYRDVKEENYTRPRDVKDSREAATFAGFAPMVPKSLPFGFQIQDIQVKDSASRKTVMFQITDGLARATIYQWRSDKSDSNLKSLEDNSVGEKNGIRVMVVSDLDEEVRLRILRAFLLQILRVPAIEARLVGFNEKGLSAARELELLMPGCISVQGEWYRLTITASA